MKSKYGVEYDVNESDYAIERNGFIFRFSTPVHMNRFEKDVKKREEWLNDSMKRRFKIPCEMTLLADVQLYIMVENRGFSITDIENDVIYTKAEEITCCGTMRQSGSCARQ